MRKTYLYIGLKLTFSFFVILAHNTLQAKKKFNSKA